MKSISTTLLLLLAIPVISFGQFNTLKKLGSEISRKTENLLIDKASDAIVKKIDEKAEEELQKSYNKEDSIARANGEEPKYADYSQFLKAMDKSKEVPASYDFTLQVLTILTDEKKNEQEITYFFSKERDYFGMEMTDEKGNPSLIVLDNENKLTAIYSEEDGVKKAVAMPNMMDVAAAFADSEYNQADQEQYSIKTTGKTKTIAGYSAIEYEVKSEDGITNTYVTDQLDYDWSEAYGAIFKQFVNKKSQQEFLKVKGIALESTSYDKKGEQISKWVTKEIKKNPFYIHNKDYEFQDMGSYQE